MSTIVLLLYIYLGVVFLAAVIWIVGVALFEKYKIK